MKLAVNNIKHRITPQNVQNGHAGFSSPKNQTSFGASKLLYSTESVKSLAVVTKAVDDALDGQFSKVVDECETIIKGTKFEELFKKSAENIEISDKNVFGKLIEGISYPFSNMWLDLTNSLLGGIKKIQRFANNETVNNIYNSKILTNRRIANRSEILMHAIQGMKESADDPEKLVNIVNKNFAKANGNYNTKYERALNRLATGLVSATFVGRDFYNLSMYQNDDHERAKEAESKRFKQEVKRIGISAFLSFAVLSAFSKYTNKNIYVAAASIAGATLFSEIVSRVTNGTPLVPLTPQKAKEYNLKKQNLKAENKNQSFKGENKTQNTQNTPALPSLTLEEFANQTKTKGTFDIKNTQNTKDSQKQEKTEAPKEQKSKLNLKKIIIGVIGLAGAGFALKLGKAKSENFAKGLDNFTDAINTGYKKLTQKDVLAEKNQILNLINRIEKSGNIEIAKSYKEILNSESTQKVTKNGKEYYNLGKTDTFVRGFGKIFEKLWSWVKAPYNGLLYVLPRSFKENVLGIMPKTDLPEENHAKDALKEIWRHYGKMAQENNGKFEERISNEILNTFNTTTNSQYSNTSLAMLSRTFVTMIAGYFFVNDFRNQVLIESNGEDTERAKEVTKERIGHKLVNFFTNATWMTIFNTIFEKQYLGSLIGATLVSAATELTNESTIRYSIGVPLTRKDSQEDIAEFEEKNFNNDGPYGKWIKFVSKVTGKKPLGEKLKEKQAK